jgi:KaiC/GvpD/RAD55 family RecA-like ATPase
MNSMHHKVPTGIPGFDELVEGGFNANSVNLIAAGPGCGKTLFCLQYLWNGITKFNENGLFISFEENIEDLKKDAAALGWNFEEYEKQHKMRFVYFHPYEVRDIHRELERQIEQVGAKRVVIDSTSVYGMTLETAFEVRKGLFDLTLILKRLGCVSLLTTEVSDGGGMSKLSRFGVEEFLADSIILISFESMGGEFSRSLIVRKMRRTKNNEDIHPLEISKEGLKVHTLK